MPHSFEQFLVWLLGGDADASQLSIGHMVVRAVIVYIAAIILVRMGKKRFMGGHTAFDMLMGHHRLGPKPRHQRVGLVYRDHRGGIRTRRSTLARRGRSRSIPNASAS